MRSLFAIILLVLGVAQSARAQGTVLFANDAKSLVCCGGQPAPAGFYTVGLYAGASEDSLSLVATVLVNPVPGRFNGGAVSIPGIPGGATATLQIRAWTTAGGSTFEEAVASPLLVVAGIGSIWTQSTGNPDSDPPSTPTPITQGFTGLNMQSLSFPDFCPIPEPPTLLLGMIGGMALLLWNGRRSRSSPKGSVNSIVPFRPHRPAREEAGVVNKYY